jgi:3-deoxy-D-manno-octulosonic acid kinase
LNAGNILLSEEQVYLLDFDRARFSASTNFRANLRRLQRSFEKIARRNPVFHYQPSDFEQLMTGYLDFFNSELVPSL